MSLYNFSFLIIFLTLNKVSDAFSPLMQTRGNPGQTKVSTSKMSFYTGDFSSKTKNGLYMPSWDVRGMRMADPDTPPEVDPTRRDPNDPEPFVPVRLPVVDFGMLPSWL